MTEPHASEPDPADVRDEVFVVIAAYDEEAAVADVVARVREVYPNVVVVDDGSTDRTREEALRVARFVLRHPLNRGQGAALQTGITFALRRGARFVVTFDADGQHRVEDVAALLAPVVAGECEVTIGSRFLGRAVDIPWTRKLLLKLAVVFTRLFQRVRVTDAHNGLRAFSRRAAEPLDIKLDGMAHASELISFIRRHGLSFREVPVQVRYTDRSLAKGQRGSAAVKIVLDYVLGRILP